MAQIATLEQECVARRGWFTSEQFARVLGLCMFLPGPEAQQMVAWIAWRAGGWRDAALATFLFVAPGLFCCGVLATAYSAYGQLPLVAGALDGARAAVAGVILVAAYRLSRGALVERHRQVAAGMSLVGLCLGAPFVVLAFAAGAFGWFFHPEVDGAPTSLSPLLREALGRLVRYLLPLVLGFLLLWALLGHHHGVVRLAEVSFLSLLAAFGGAYSALGLWRARVVGSYGWMTDARFGDALVIGEATPGPLLLAGSFVGCVAGFQGQLGLPGGWPAGLVGLLIPAVFTFGPSTVILLAMAPLAEEGVGDRRFHALVGMVTATATAAVFWLGALLLLDQYARPVMILVAVGAGVALATRRLSVPMIVVSGAVFGWFYARV